jgi:hypothetical protein
MNHTDIVEFFLDREDVDSGICDGKSITPRKLAMQNRSKDIVRLFDLTLSRSNVLPEP